jgi:hypothetical protein
LRALSAADVEGALKLIQVVQPADPWSVQHYRWQLLDGPAGPAEIRAIEFSNRIVALYAATRKRLRVDSRLVEAWMVQDVMTHPEFRGRGFLNSMAAAIKVEMSTRGVVGFTFPNKFSENSFRRNAWTELCRVPLRVANVRAGSRTDVLRPIDGFAEDVDAIWEESGLETGVHRDAAFLNWRYRRPATLYHRFVTAGNEGFIVLKVYDHGGIRIVHICDLVVRQRARDLLGELLANVHAFAATNGAARLTSWLPQGHPYDEAFSAAGFHRDEDSDRFVFIDGPPDLLPALTRPASWHLTQGDSDVY